MKKNIKIILTIISIIILCFILDIVCIFTINKPIFAIKKDNIYKGIFYNTYNCSEYTVPQIKSKKTKFTCSDIKIGTVINIKDLDNYNIKYIKESKYE